MLSCSTLLFSSKFRILILIEKLKENNDLMNQMVIFNFGKSLNFFFLGVKTKNNS